jgi:glyoxylase-like metal-dependent hydrolase (beta-lactamase superfamily II)
MDEPVYKLYPLHCGRCLLGENHVLGDGYSDDDRIEFVLYAFLADGGPGRRVLIDLGPVGLEYLNEMFRHFDFFRRGVPGDPDAIVQPHGNVFDWLNRFKLKPDDINHVIFTHMHADHHGLTDGKDGGAVMRFPRAKVHVSRKGWQANLDRRVDGQWHSYVDFAFADYLLKEEQTGRVVFHDDCEILPGIDVFYLGGHAVCSQGIRIRTTHGPAVVASDEIYRYDLLERGVLARLYTTPRRLEEATNRLAKMSGAGAVLLPCHEPLLARLYTVHGDDWLHVAEPIAQRAAQGWSHSRRKPAGTKPA